MTEHALSDQSLAEANRDRAKFSGHDGALGAAGVTEDSFAPGNSSHLMHPGQSIAITPKNVRFEEILITATWTNALVRRSGFFGRIFKKALHVGVDLDLGCLYELEDGKRGCLQAFGKKFGALSEPPYIKLSGDDRTGDARGVDESMLIKGENWPHIKKMLVYIYIYKGAPNWAAVNPRIKINVPGEEDLVVSLSSHKKRLALCAIGGLENVRGGIKLTNYTEYFPGHAEMDRAFGYGLNWEEGKK